MKLDVHGGSDSKIITSVKLQATLVAVLRG